jgi:polysaccharide biosynthesis/export protein
LGKAVRECKVYDQTSSFATVFIATLLLALSAALCQAAEPPLSPEQQRTGMLGVGDWVTIEIQGQRDSTSSYVNADGTITVPLAGNVPVAGISPVQAAARVAKALMDGGYFIDPHVTVRVTQPLSQLVSVLGEVETPGRFPITARTTIVDLLAQAGGMKETASDMGYLLRSDDTGHTVNYPIKLNMANGSKEAPPTWVLQGGDSLVVPRADHFSVIGEVTTPGRYPLEPGMTVIQAIARAGGITERGSERRIQVKRADKPGHYQTLSAKAGDPVMADDIIRVKESLF